MSVYFEQCADEHVENMRAREEILRIEIQVKQAELETLRKERLTLEAGIRNWKQEAEDM